MKIKYAGIILFCMFITSCGGGGDTTPVKGTPVKATSFGALAVNFKTGAAYLNARHASESAAYQQALYLCGDGCIVAAQYSGLGQCMALSRGTNLILGWAEGSVQKKTETESTTQCSDNGGVSCIMFLSFCN